MNKYCSGCKQTKSIEEFGIRNDHPEGRQQRCKTCRNRISKDWRERNPDKAKAIAERAKPKQREYYANGAGKFQSRKGLLKRYGLTHDEYEQLLFSQNGVCAICKREETRSKTPLLSIDHCHTTGNIRGLLCAKCNSALGHFEDNIENMQTAIEYLKKHQPTNLFIP